MQIVLMIIAIVFAIAMLTYIWPVVLAAGLVYLTIRIVRYVRMRRFFASEEFLAKKLEIAAVVAEHNEVTSYVAEIRNNNSFELGVSSSGEHAHLAQFENTSKQKHRRDRNVASYGASNVHNCSLQTVRNAKADPIKYLIKYFDINATEEGVADVESLGDSIARLEEAVSNLQEREESITSALNPPKFILKHYNKRFMQEIGVDLSPITVPYPSYAFEYVSAGGNSSQKTKIDMNTPTIDAVIATLAEKIKFAKSAAGQRALMTTKLRNEIKERDNHTCKTCSVSIEMEEHLLLEVDHIIPVSRGGLSTHENLQTLCWRCNRTKSNKILES